MEFKDDLVANKTSQDYNKSEKEKEVLDSIQSDKTNKKINRGNQLKHILREGVDIGHRSYITGTLEDAQNLVNQYSGTGEPKFSSKGKWTDKEFVVADHVIGFVVDPDTGNAEETRRFSIHYGKRGTHIVPAKEKTDEHKRSRGEKRENPSV